MMIRRALPAVGGVWRRGRILDVAPLKRMLRVNGDIFVRTLCLVFAFAYFTVEGARMGDVILAANAVLLNMVIFTAYALDGFSGASQALVGRAVGARSRADYRGVVDVARNGEKVSLGMDVASRIRVKLA